MPATNTENDHNPRDSVIGIILAGGLGTRLRGVHPDCPKPLVPCVNRPFIEWVLSAARRAGIDNFVVSLGHLAHVAQHYFELREADGLRISTTVEPHPLGTAGAVRFAWEGHQDQAAIVLNGDSLLLADFSPVWNMWRETNADALLIGTPQSDTSRYGTLTLADDSRLLSFEEKRPGLGIINSGIYLFRPKLLQTIPLGVPLSLERDMFPDWLRSGFDIRVCVLSGPFLDIGLPESLAEADDFLRRHWQKESAT